MFLHFHILQHLLLPPFFQQVVISFQVLFFHLGSMRVGFLNPVDVTDEVLAWMLYGGFLELALGLRPIAFDSLLF